MKWPVKKLGDVANICSGGTPDRSNKSYYGGDIAWVKSGELSQKLIIDTEEKITKAGLENSSAKIVNEGTILMAMYGATVGLVSVLGVRAATNQAVCCIEVKAEVNKQYLLAYLKTLKDYLLANRVGGAQPNLNQNFIKNLKIPLPPLAEQQRIAALLDTADRILKQRESAITKLDQLASTTFDEMYDALDAVSTKSLGEILELQRGASPRPIADWMTEDEDGVNWIKIADATASDKYIFKCKERIKKEAVAMTRYVKSGDFLLSNSMSFGRPYILKTDGCIHDGWLLLRDTKNIFEQDFLYAVLSCKTVKEQFKKLATGAVVKNLNIDAVSKVKVKIPEKNIQKIFSEKMHELEANKATHLKQLTIIKNLLSSLQHQSFAVN